MKNKWPIVSVGFALFSMFFGSGNLVFPITVGQESSGHYFLASLGIIFTGVIVPFLGVLGMMLYKGEIVSFFGCFGKKGIFVFSFLALALMGPFGVLARCLTVAHGALLLLFPNASLPLTSFFMCILIYLLALNQGKIVKILGSILTPFLLVAIAIIAYFGLSQNISPAEAQIDLSSWTALKNGFFQGYQTMDLLAAFFFSQFVIKSLRERSSESSTDSSSIKIFFKASLIGAFLLSSVYFVLVLLGWLYSPMLLGQPAQEMLGIIALHSLGSMAAPCVCLAISSACLTTAIVLASLFAEFLSKDVSQNIIGNRQALFITLGIGFFVSTFEFAGIAKFMGPILEMVYPALIILTLFNIINKLYGIRTTHWPFTVTLLAKFCLL